MFTYLIIRPTFSALIVLFWPRVFHRVLVETDPTVLPFNLAPRGIVVVPDAGTVLNPMIRERELAVTAAVGHD